MNVGDALGDQGAFFTGVSRWTGREWQWMARPPTWGHKGWWWRHHCNLTVSYREGSGLPQPPQLMRCQYAFHTQPRSVFHTLHT